MNIYQALALKEGDTVYCPANRGDAGYTGRVEHVGEAMCHNHQQVPYVWVSVRHLGPQGHASVYPSNRLALA